jgi:hypothetical protein
MGSAIPGLAKEQDKQIEPITSDMRRDPLAG